MILSDLEELDAKNKKKPVSSFSPTLSLSLSLSLYLSLCLSLSLALSLSLSLCLSHVGLLDFSPKKKSHSQRVGNRSKYR